MKIIRAALFSFLISVVTFLPTFLNPSDASSSAIANNVSAPMSVTTATYSVYPSSTLTNPSPPAIGGLVLGSSSATQNFYVFNNGTISVASFNLSVTDNPVVSFTLTRCGVNVDFNLGKSTCATGSSTTVTPTAITSGPGLITFAIPFAVGSWYAFQFTPNITKKIPATIPTINTSVTSAQARTASTTNS